jgi:diguanylate cyclase (GGDEF)-like protein
VDTPRRPPAWLCWIGVGCLLIAVVQALPEGPWRSGLTTGFGFASAATALVGARRHRPPDAAPWRWFAAGIALWATGDLCWVWQPGFLTWQLSTAADVPYLLAYPAFAAGACRLLRTRSAGRGRSELLDAAVVSTGFALLTWCFIMRPILDDSTLSTGRQVLELSYPAGDVLLFTMTIRLLAASGARTAGHRLLIAAIGTQLIYDLWYAATIGLAIDVDPVIDAATVPVYAIWGAAALHPAAGDLTGVAKARTEGLSRRRGALLAGASLLAPAVLAVQGYHGDGVITDWPAITVCSMVLFLLVLWRMAGLVSQVQEQAARLRALAHHDALTGVPNRRAWDLELAARTGSAGQVVVALLDIDHFKRYNDAFGHPAGDRLLRDSTAAWCAHLPAGGLLARYGGEEFAVLLAGIRLPDATAILDRMRRATPAGQTFSAGVAVWDGRESPEQLTARADEALYRAKNAGRDRITVAPTLPAAA